MAGIEPTPLAAVKAVLVSAWGVLTTFASVVTSASAGAVVAMAGPIAVPDDDDDEDEEGSGTVQVTAEAAATDDETLSAGFDGETGSVREEAETTPEHGSVTTTDPEAEATETVEPRETPVDAVEDGLDVAVEKARSVFSGDAVESAGDRADDAAVSAAERASEFSLIGAVRYVARYPVQFAEMALFVGLLAVGTALVDPWYVGLFLSLLPATSIVVRYTQRWVAVVEHGNAEVSRNGPIDRLIDGSLHLLTTVVYALPYGDRLVDAQRSAFAAVGLAMGRKRDQFAAWWSTWAFWSTLGELSVAAMSGGAMLVGRAVPGSRSTRAADWFATEISRRMTYTFRGMGRRSRRFVTWSGQRPFWGGVTLGVGAFVVGWIPAHLAMMIAIIPGSIAFVGLIFAVLMGLCAVFSVLKPQLSSFLGWFGIVLSVLSIMGGALGGFFLGTIIGITGGAMLVAWERPEDADPANAESPSKTSNSRLATGD